MAYRLFYGVTTALVVAAMAVWLIPASAAAPQAPAPNTDTQSALTPRAPHGNPDLSGLWAGGGGGGASAVDNAGNVTVLNRGRPCHPGQECGPAVNFERDSGVSQRMHTNKPLYKPEYWEKVQQLDVNGNQEDPSGHCYPQGVPRMGPPDKIFQTADEMAFLYRGHNTFRVIPIDGREHDPIRSKDLTWYGDAVGHWEGDTLVIDVVGLTHESWLGWPGYFHTWDVRVVERLRRQGDTLTWQATVYDPEVLMEPWQMDSVRRRLNPNQKVLLEEDLPCQERDLANMVARERG